MLVPEGYVTLSELWEQFRQRHGEAVAADARAMYVQPEPDPNFQGFDAENGFAYRFVEVGSPADHVEQVFIEAFDSYVLTLAKPDGSTLRAIAKDPASSFRLLDRLSVFETTCTLQDEAEAERARPYLAVMGSHGFHVWPHRRAGHRPWAAAYAEAPAAASPLADIPFHTLPYTFERHRFAIPETLPPWIDDPLDRAFVSRLRAGALGAIVCLDAAAAKRWAKDVLRPSWRLTLPPGHPRAEGAVGRERRRDRAVAAYKRLFPRRHNGTWKEAVRAVMQETGEPISIKTLQRGLNGTESDGTKAD